MTERDPSVIRSLAVTVTDVIDAFVFTQENPGTAVLRLTPPFHGRMRARLHVFHVDDAPVTGAIHISAESLLADEVLEHYPAWKRDGKPESVSVDSSADSYATAVSNWRERARTAVVDEVEFVVRDDITATDDAESGGGFVPIEPDGRHETAGTGSSERYRVRVVTLE